eukprot:TRINITY_DN14937_c0_g1_i1.p1 TRINITY_DN14937_c0_g1~~TRINITY_DN14937_c0_g1_i1.p1  ORF type:complete len:423 (+),score=104.02 TRINITY_DN14937_c0_g1_i1:53-1321(+)
MADSTELPLPNGGKIVLHPNSLEGLRTPGKGAASLSRRHVYGSSTRGNYVYIHFVQFPVKHDPMGPQGLPLKGGTWYDQAAFAQLSFPTESDAVAAQHCAAIKEWAAPVRRTIFVIANPRSGKGKGARVAAVIESQLRFTRHDVTVQMTKSPGEATAIAKNLLIDDDSIVATVGGDGTMCEALEGLFQRNDKDTRPFTVCYVPAGSSNAVAHMTGHADPVTATWSLLKGDSRPMDLMEFKQEDRVRYGALSVTSGLVSDIDIDSEMCRCCGPTRFTLYAVMKIFCCCVCCKCCFPVHANLKYPMRIHYVTSDKPKPSGAWDINDSSQGWETWEGDALHAVCCDEDLLLLRVLQVLLPGARKPEVPHADPLRHIRQAQALRRVGYQRLLSGVGDVGGRHAVLPPAHRPLHRPDGEARPDLPCG